VKITSSVLQEILTRGEIFS